MELYFSSTRSGNSDIYVSALQPDGSFGVPLALSELNTSANEFRPHVRRDGLEIFFDSNRPGSENLDVWTATRLTAAATWSDPVKLGSSVNSPAGETRPYLSWDATTLYFGSTRADLGDGSTDIYIARRDKVTGPR